MQKRTHNSQENSQR